MLVKAFVCEQVIVIYVTLTARINTRFFGGEGNQGVCGRLMQQQKWYLCFQGP